MLPLTITLSTTNICIREDQRVSRSGVPKKQIMCLFLISKRVGTIIHPAVKCPDNRGIICPVSGSENNSESCVLLKEHDPIFPRIHACPRFGWRSETHAKPFSQGLEWRGRDVGSSQNPKNGIREGCSSDTRAVSESEPPLLSKVFRVFSVFFFS